MLAHSPKWQYIYDISCDVGKWPLEFDNHDRLAFSKWCQFYKRIFENYDEDARPNERMMWYDVLVDARLKELRDNRKKAQSGKEKPGLNVTTIGKSFKPSGRNRIRA